MLGFITKVFCRTTKFIERIRESIAFCPARRPSREKAFYFRRPPNIHYQACSLTTTGSPRPLFMEVKAPLLLRRFFPPCNSSQRLFMVLYGRGAGRKRAVDSGGVGGRAERFYRFALQLLLYTMGQMTIVVGLARHKCGRFSCRSWEKGQLGKDPTERRLPSVLYIVRGNCEGPSGRSTSVFPTVARGSEHAHNQITTFTVLSFCTLAPPLSLGNAVA